MSFRKIWLIVRSEYWRRVRSKAFILATLLVPLGFILVDQTGRLADSLAAAGDEQLTFRRVDAPTDSVRAAVRDGEYDGYLLLPDSLLAGKGQATYYSMQGGGLTDRIQIGDRVDRVVQQQRLRAADATQSILSILKAEVSVESRTIQEEGTGADHTLAYTAIGYVMAFVIYFAVFVYGQYVMQGVIEEKSSRVVEIIVSSVRPFELLMGKVIGIGAMGLTQMVVWSALVIGGLASAAPLLALFLDPASLVVSPDASSTAMAEAAGLSIPPVPYALIGWFVLFFLGGFLLYASLFAAVGSAVEQQQDAQNLLLPVMTPLILPILFLAFVLESPDATVSIVLSLVPFFSPILMMLRAAITTVPAWQMGLAVGLLGAAFLGMIWLAGRIYRVGILSYGKTPSLREIARWATYR